MAQRVCLKHVMPNGTIMEGPTHGHMQTCIEYGSSTYAKGGKIINPLFKGKKRVTAKDFSAGGKYSSGGMLVGPSHEDGGIPAIVDGTEPIEVEGGEFVINKKTAEAVGEDFLHKLNSTDTPYHPPAQGFQEGQLPSPSQYTKGGKLSENKRGILPSGRKITKSKPYEVGGSVKSGKMAGRSQSPVHYGINKSCTHITSKYDCDGINGCSWNINLGSCR